MQLNGRESGTLRGRGTEEVVGELVTERESKRQVRLGSVFALK